ncbi:MAG TPA: tRNA lysidine(34) synthetase TilS, partial [Gammaproteobacteria bacterium]
LGAAPLRVRLRRGGESLQPLGQAHRRTLKRLLQEAGVPPWQRGRLPLVYLGERLVAVADRWLEAGCAAAPGEAGLALQWDDHGSGVN